MSEERFVLRSARPSDRAAVLALVPRLRAFGPSTLRPADALDAAEVRTLERYFDTAPAGTALRVAEGVEGVLLGMAYAEPAVDYFTGETHGHLAILAVAAEAEGRGVGRALLEAVEGWAEASGHRFLTLNVFAGNRRAITVYERAGYRPDAVKYLKEIVPAAPGPTGG